MLLRFLFVVVLGAALATGTVHLASGSRAGIELAKPRGTPLTLGRDNELIFQLRFADRDIRVAIDGRSAGRSDAEISYTCGPAACVPARTSRRCARGHLGRWRGPWSGESASWSRDAGMRPPRAYACGSQPSSTRRRTHSRCESATPRRSDWR